MSNGGGFYLNGAMMLKILPNDVAPSTIMGTEKNSEADPELPPAKVRLRLQGMP